MSSQESSSAKIITLRAIALKHRIAYLLRTRCQAKIITLRAIALKRVGQRQGVEVVSREDHNATSYSTETSMRSSSRFKLLSEDHNATSYSTETRLSAEQRSERLSCEDHNATSYSTETLLKFSTDFIVNFAKIITLRAIALKRGVRPTAVGVNSRRS